MASDISLAVGDGARRMTYQELAAVRGISSASAKRLAQRHRWGRQVGNDGVARVTVPLSALVNTMRVKDVAGDVIGDVAPAVIPVTTSRAVQTKGKGVAGDTEAMSPATGVTGSVTLTDVIGDVAPAVIPVTEAFAQAVETLREQLAIAHGRADHAERQLEEERRRVNEERARGDTLSAALAEERRRVIEILTGPRRPWWRRWLR